MWSEIPVAPELSDPVPINFSLDFLATPGDSGAHTSLEITDLGCACGMNGKEEVI